MRKAQVFLGLGSFLSCSIFQFVRSDILYTLSKSFSS